MGSGSSTGGKYRYYVLIVLMLTYMFNITDRLAMSILIEDIKGEFILNDTQIGMLAGMAFTVFYVLLGIPAGLLADRTNRKNMVAIAVSLWSIMAALCGLAVGFWTLFLARLGVGVGEAGGGPPSTSMLTDYFEPHELSRAMGIYSIGAVLGPTVGFIAGGFLVEAYGWRWTFIILGLPGVLMGVLLYFTVKEPRRGQYFKPTAQQIGPEPGKGFFDTIPTLLRNQVYVRVALANAVAMVASYAFVIWLAPILLRNFDIPVSMVGLYLGVTWLIGGIPGMIGGGMLTDWLSAKNPKWRAWFSAMVVALALIPLCLSLLADSVLSALALYALGYALLVATQGPAISMMQTAVRPNERGIGSSFAGLSATFLGYALGPLFVGMISDNLAASEGPMSLNYGVIAITVISLIPGALAYIWASRAIDSRPVALPA